ncbi:MULTISPECIES: aminotransferase class IV [unclassified Moraxella]|uniref:aminotransferase class IV n=1 Tax=unclassified Moraxella TaxID=2685852 RepID=UPI003AF4A6DE
MWYELYSVFLGNYQPLTTLDIDERVIAYGDGFFTTMAVVAGEVNWLDYHIQRVVDSCDALQLTLDIPTLVTAVQAHAQAMGQGVLKLIVCRKNQPVKGYGFVNGDAHTWVKRMPSDTPLAQIPQRIILQPPSQAVCLTQQIACLPKPLAGLKLLNAQDKVLASRELLTYQINAQDSQRTSNLPIIEGLVKNVMGEWVEGTFCNIFYQLKSIDVNTVSTDSQQWFTPPLDNSGVKGVMRQVIMDNLAKHQQPVIERVLSDADLGELSGLLVCNAVRGVIPISILQLPNGDSVTFADFFINFNR